MLIILCGLPAVGKTTIARALASDLGAVHLRIDTIEQAILRSGALHEPLGAVGYAIAYAVAEDILRQGMTVVADSVNPFAVTRQAWHAVAAAAATGYLDVEVVCSDREEHRRRAVTRSTDIPGHRQPTWEEIVGREYEGWSVPPLVIDTARSSVEESVAAVRAHLGQSPSGSST